MKLLYIAPSQSIHTRRWLSAFVARGHEVHLAVVPGDPLPDTPGVAVHPLPAGRPKARFLSWTKALRQLGRSTGADVIHGHYLTRYGWLAAASLIRPVVLTAWGTDAYIDPARSPMSALATRAALRRADLVTVDARDLQDRVLALGARPGRTTVVQWGVDTDVFRPDVDTTSLRTRLGLGEAPVILSTRAVTPLYNQHELVAALPAIRASVPNARLIIKYGASDAAYLERVKSDVERRGLTGAVHFVDQTPYNELAAYYALGAVFVSIASSDSTPVSLLEAMACGAAPVVSDLPALAEWVTDGENGRRIAATADAVATAVVPLLRDKALRERIALANRRMVEEKASHRREMDRMEGLYGELRARGKR